MQHVENDFASKRKSTPTPTSILTGAYCN